ncbi:ATP-dependent Clp protease adaptor ClpS [Sandaracinomonas limnophila]|uniref:ATP-dependent Clp protease adaptor ClpS n=1 Tax=Sandaracinomonas limnophila TaxID=1862386 RepID=A0A437PW65_9BACT|nr:ATP-dependent Clp protease adaptor ClpS [Sandaracinomonas limnophila]RVU26499.1 ATP-dependent Clp protease adaptor ClpS [Sandaracinomonas limnophila]
MQLLAKNISKTCNSFSTQPNWQEETEVLVEEKLEESHQLIVFNDEVNTFDFVIQTLIEVCQHSVEQAEQCTLQIHFKGKCGVKAGEFDELTAMRNEICRRGISAEIE